MTDKVETIVEQTTENKEVIVNPTEATVNETPTTEVKPTEEVKPEVNPLQEEFEKLKSDNLAYDTKYKEKMAEIEKLSGEVEILKSFKSEMKDKLMSNFSDEQKETFKDLSYEQITAISKISGSNKTSQGVEETPKEFDKKSTKEMYLKEYLAKAAGGVYDDELYKKAIG